MYLVDSVGGERREVDDVTNNKTQVSVPLSLCDSSNLIF